MFLGKCILVQKPESTLAQAFAIAASKSREAQSGLHEVAERLGDAKILLLRC